MTPSRRRRALADATLPVCDKSKATWPPGAEAACNAHVLVNVGYGGGVFNRAQLMRMCGSDACLAVTNAMRAANPSECLSGYESPLYRDFLNQLDTTCPAMVATSSGDHDDSATESPSPTRTTTAKPSPSVNAKKTPAPSPKSASHSNTTTIIIDSGSSGSSIESASPPPETSSDRDPSKSVVTSHQSSSGSSNDDDLPQTFESPAASSWIQTTTPPSQGKTPAPTNGSIDTAQSTAPASSSSSGVTIPAIVGVVVCLAVVAVFILRQRRRAASQPHKSASSPATIETGRYQDEDATFATLDSSDQDSTSDSTHHSSRLVRADLAPLLEPLVAWQIDSSEITDVSLIGTGAQAAVYLVQLNTTRLLVSKRLVPDQLTERKLKSLVEEIQLVATLQHPSIVGFVGVAWSSPFNLQALFEYMPNGDLRSYLDKHKPGEAPSWTRRKLEMALAVAEGLAYVHSFNPPIVHRDLKARNILLDDNYVAKISDFGVSRLQSEDGTMTTGIGTSRWLAPEVIAGGGLYTEQCDIYSFGVVLVEMDTHALPFATVDTTMSEIMLLRHVSRGEMRPTVSSSCDPRVAALVDWCLQHSPQKRPNALELAFELRQILKSTG